MPELLSPLGAGHFPKLTCCCKRVLQPDRPSGSARPAGSHSDSAGWHAGSVADAWPEAVPLAAAAASVQSATLHLIMGT